MHDSRDDTVRDATGMPSSKGTPKPLGTGDIIAGRYAIERILGIGGMGRVFAARHLKLGTLVAVKVVHPELVKEHDTVARFLREAHAMAKLRNEYTVRVLDVGETDDGLPFIIMEHLDGKDLGVMVMESGRLPIALAVDYVRQACFALAEAHDLGVIHRDLKPQNLFLAGRVRVLDFGLAKAVTGHAMEKLTLAGHAMGTPHYMAPEQLRHDGVVDRRADIWALGVTLHRLLTRAYPFDEKNPALAAAMILSQEPTPVRQVRPEVPEVVASIVARCLQKNPQMRFQSMHELGDALERAKMVLGDPSFKSVSLNATRPTPRSALSSSAVRSLGAAVGGVIVGLAALVVWLRHHPPPSPAAPPPAAFASAAPAPPPTASIAPAPVVASAAAASAEEPASPVATAASVVRVTSPRAKPSATAVPPPSATASSGRASVYDSL